MYWYGADRPRRLGTPFRYPKHAHSLQNVLDLVFTHVNELCEPTTAYGVYIGMKAAVIAAPNPNTARQLLWESRNVAANHVGSGSFVS